MPPAVQEQRPQQTQQAKPAAERAAPDPFEEPIAYLKAHGFKPLGNPEWPQTLWIDTTKPLLGEEHYELKKAHFLRRNQQTNKVEAVLEQVMANDGTGKQAPVQQLCYTPPPAPVTMQAALQMVMERELRKQTEAEKAKR